MNEQFLIQLGQKLQGINDRIKHFKGKQAACGGDKSKIIKELRTVRDSFTRMYVDFGGKGWFGNE